MVRCSKSHISSFHRQQAVVNTLFLRSSSNAPSQGHFQAPRSVFFYGRGGAQNLSCVFRFEAGPGERVKLTITRARFGSRSCSQRQDARTGRWECEARGEARGRVEPRAELWVSEYPWPGVAVARDCICSRLAAPIVISTLTSPIVEVNFTVSQMNITQDYNDFHFVVSMFCDIIQKRIKCNT